MEFSSQGWEMVAYVGMVDEGRFAQAEELKLRYITSNEEELEYTRAISKMEECGEGVRGRSQDPMTDAPLLQNGCVGV